MDKYAPFNYILTESSTESFLVEKQLTLLKLIYRVCHFPYVNRPSLYKAVHCHLYKSSFEIYMYKKPILLT